MGPHKMHPSSIFFIFLEKSIYFSFYWFPRGSRRFLSITKMVILTRYHKIMHFLHFLNRAMKRASQVCKVFKSLLPRTFLKIHRRKRKNHTKNIPNSMTSQKRETRNFEKFKRFLLFWNKSKKTKKSWFFLKFWKVEIIASSGETHFLSVFSKEKTSWDVNIHAKAPFFLVFCLKNVKKEQKKELFLALFLTLFCPPKCFLNKKCFICIG